MKLFSRKGNRMTTGTVMQTSQDLLRELQPKRLELAALKQQLEAAQRQRDDFEREYEEEPDEGKLWKIREKQNANMTYIERVERKIAAKQAELQPLEAEYYQLTNKEKLERDEKELASFIEANA